MIVILPERESVDPSEIPGSSNTALTGCCLWELTWTLCHFFSFLSLMLRWKDCHMFDASLGLCIKFYTNLGYRGNPCSYQKERDDLPEQHRTCCRNNQQRHSLFGKKLTLVMQCCCAIPDPGVLKGHVRSTALKKYRVLHVLSFFIFQMIVNSV